MWLLLLIVLTTADGYGLSRHGGVWRQQDLQGPANTPKMLICFHGYSHRSQQSFPPAEPL